MLAAEACTVLTLLQGLALSHAPSKRICIRKAWIELLLAIVLAHYSTSAAVAAATAAAGTTLPSLFALDMLMCILVDSPHAQATFQHIGGLQQIVHLSHRCAEAVANGAQPNPLDRDRGPLLRALKQTDIHCLEFRFFYAQITRQPIPTPTPTGTPKRARTQSATPAEPAPAPAPAPEPEPDSDPNSDPGSGSGSWYIVPAVSPKKVQASARPSTPSTPRASASQNLLTSSSRENLPARRPRPQKQAQAQAQGAVGQTRRDKENNSEVEIEVAPLHVPKKAIPPIPPSPAVRRAQIARAQSQSQSRSRSRSLSPRKPAASRPRHVPPSPSRAAGAQ